MNAWVPKPKLDGEVIRVTAGGAGKLAIGSAGSLASLTIETSYDGGQNWIDIKAAFSETGVGPYLHVHVADPAAPYLLGSQLRVSGADYSVIQED